MYVADARAEEYLAAGHKPAADAAFMPEPIEPIETAQEVKKPAKRRTAKK